MDVKLVAFSILLIFSCDFCVGHSDGFRPQILRRALRSVNQQNYVFDKFANTYGINRTQFQNLMKDLGLDNKNLGQNSKCMTANNVFATNGYSNTQYLNISSFQIACPTLLEQIIKKSCVGIKATNHNHGNHHHHGQASGPKVESAKAWGYSILAVTIISLASMLGAFVVPFMNKEFYKKVLLFMVALAVGVLGGSGIFHLMPHSFGLGEDGTKSHLWYCCVIVGGIYFFFITENLMKMYIRFSDWKKKKVTSSKIGQKVNENYLSGTTGSLNIAVIVDGVHDAHALDSVHVSDKNCEHEHGINSMNMAGDHGLNKKDTSEYFASSSAEMGFFESVAPVAWMIILGDGLHNFIDGLAIGVSFSNNVMQGMSTSLAIFCEELPHELGDFAILLNSGFTYKQAILANFLSACTCYLGMIIGIIVGTKTHAVHWIYALAAGMFLYISLVDMLPEVTGMHVTISSTSKKETWMNFIIVNFAMLLGFGLMLLLAVYSHDIKI